MVTPSGPEVQSVSISGESLKVTLDELADVTDWTKLVVTLEEATVSTWSRRTNSLYFKGIAEGETLVTIGYDGSPVRTFKLVVTA